MVWQVAFHQSRGPARPAVVLLIHGVLTVALATTWPSWSKSTVLVPLVPGRCRLNMPYNSRPFYIPPQTGGVAFYTLIFFSDFARSVREMPIFSQDISLRTGVVWAILIPSYRESFRPGDGLGRQERNWGRKGMKQYDGHCGGRRCGGRRRGQGASRRKGSFLVVERALDVWARAPARQTPPLCTPGSTRSPAPGKRR